jgi:hypothetical protein
MADLSSSNVVSNTYSRIQSSSVITVDMESTSLRR